MNSNPVASGVSTFCLPFSPSPVSPHLYQSETGLRPLLSSNRLDGTAILSVLPNRKRSLQIDVTIVTVQYYTSHSYKLQLQWPTVEKRGFRCLSSVVAGYTFNYRSTGLHGKPPICILSCFLSRQHVHQSGHLLSPYSKTIPVLATSRL